MTLKSDFDDIVRDYIALWKPVTITKGKDFTVLLFEFKYQAVNCRTMIDRTAETFGIKTASNNNQVVLMMADKEK